MNCVQHTSLTVLPPDQTSDEFLHKILSVCRFMPEVSGISLRGPLRSPLGPVWPHMKTMIGPLWEFLKGPQLGVRGSPRSSTFCMQASAGVLNPSVAQLSLMWRLDSYAKRSRGGASVNTSACVRWQQTQRHFQKGVAENTTEEERSCSCKVGGQTSDTVWDAGCSSL